MDATASYLFSSRFQQVRAGAAFPLGVVAAAGLEARYVEDKFSGGFKDPVYSIYLPVQLDLDMLQLNLTPFYYVENKAHDIQFQDASAYGITTQLVMDLVKDDVDEVYTQARLTFSYARQKGNVKESNQWQSKNYDQTAYTLGLRQNFYDAFAFQISGTAYQYPDGISRVQAFRGVLDQNDLAFTQSYDVNRQLGKYVLAARFARLWKEQRSSLYLGYHYGEFYTARPEHSVLIGNTFYIVEQAYMDLAYNHLRNTSNADKRDIFFIHLNIAF